MSLYTPVFPSARATPPLRPQSSSSIGSSSTRPTPAPTPAVYSARLSQRHISLASVPPELCPPSPSSDVDKESVEELRTRIRNALLVARGEPTSGKWAHVANLVRMGCTRGRWQGAGRRSAQWPPKESARWCLAETEEEWFEWERSRAAEKITQGAKTVTVSAKIPDPEVPAIVTEQPRLQVIEDKVKRWQVDVEPEPKPVVHSDTIAAPVAQSGAASQTLSEEDESRDPKQQPSPLGFSVVKRAAVPSAAGKKRKAAALSMQPPSTSRFFHNKDKTDVDVPRTSAMNDAPLTVSAAPAVDGIQNEKHTDTGRVNPSEPTTSRPLPRKPRIDDVSEMYIPPSFPSDLRTSTPPRKISAPLKTKPPPILPTATPLAFASPPSSPLSGLRSSPQQDIIEISSPSVGVVATRSGGEKRARSPTSSTARSKKPRQSSNTRPVTPPQQTSALVEKPRPTTVGDVSAVTNTPNRGAEPPTLTDLLASPSRSKPLQRPPKKLTITPSKESVLSKDNGNGKTHALPPVHRDASPTKTRLSSPASDSTPPPPHSPLSPLFGADFTHDPAAFAPPFASTQQHRPQPFPGGAVGIGNGLAPAGSGFLGMGYDSQFDVEGNVDRVSELLERDVDFGAWLQDVPADSQG